jgi:dihydrofolate reductase
MGKTTYDIMQWKGPKAWVLTRDREWSRSNVGTIHDLDDLHLHTEGPIYVLGGNSVHHQLRNNMDEIHLYVMNNSRGSDPWIDMDMKDWKPIEYISKGVWSYVHLEKSLNYDPLGLNDDYLKA